MDLFLCLEGQMAARCRRLLNLLEEFFKYIIIVLGVAYIIVSPQNPQQYSHLIAHLSYSRFICTYPEGTVVSCFCVYVSYSLVSMYFCFVVCLFCTVMTQLSRKLLHLTISAIVRANTSLPSVFVLIRK